ncbi:MAG: hypothetical protein HYR68_06305 [Burkholderiales bacterium]|nr:hypothetical protein [Burkholderiales bacterium]MBI3730206.1 hypothetical protein [Burkholderiales bacterium]
MSTTFAKKGTLDFLAKDNTVVGQPLNLNALFHSRIIFWDPIQQASVEAALDELVDDHVLKRQDQKYVLTKAGFDQIYPPVNDFIKSTILDWFLSRGVKAEEGLDIHTLYLHHTLMWTPRQNKSFRPGLEKMVNDGLIELKSGNIFLTQKGVETCKASQRESAHDDH